MIRRRLALLPLLALSAPADALAVNMTLVAQEQPYDGVTFRQYRTSSPATDTWVALVDLCEDRVHVTGRRASTSGATTGSWASSAGVQVATNGDFYRTSPILRVYGNAFGGGLPWPLDQTGDDPQYDYEWYWERYGWIAFGPDWVDFTHTRWVKNHPGQFGGLQEGWMNGSVQPPARPGTLALVSGFPELVVEGTPITCPSATDPSCFPDRSDMRDRHPRTAMGLTQDRQTFILAVVDGRTGSSAGMYGLELVDVMAQLGAHVAFNLDGGGSSQMWLEDGGYRNNQTGNNGGGTRSVANHWGVFAGLEGAQRLRPGHCQSLPPCAVIPPAGGTLDDSGACFQAFGPAQYWRDESAGQNGGLLWTNAWTTDLASNWAWWQIHVEQAGDYLVEVSADPAWAVYDDTPYVVRAGGAETAMRVDQSASTGWIALGSFSFDAGGEQWVAVYDDAPGSVPSGQHIVADAVRLTRLDPWCGDGSCDPDEGCAACPEDCEGPAELPDNGIDDDCDGQTDEDETGERDDDGDGFSELDGDCDDTDPSVNPYADEVPDNGIDDDCDGEIDELEGDDDDSGADDDDATPLPPLPEQGDDDDDRDAELGCGCDGGGGALLLLPIALLPRRRPR